MKLIVKPLNGEDWTKLYDCLEKSALSLKELERTSAKLAREIEIQMFDTLCQAHQMQKADIPKKKEYNKTMIIVKEILEVLKNENYSRK